MMKLVAYNPDDGAGILEVNNRLVLVEWPYSQRQEYVCTYEQMERLVIRQDWILADIEFSDGPSSIQFLRDRANEGENPLKRETDEQAFLNRYNSFPIENLMRILEASERQLDKKEDLAAVDRALNRLLDLEKVQATPELFQKARSLWKRCRAEMDVVFEIKRKSKLNHLREQADAVRAKPFWAKQLFATNDPVAGRQTDFRAA
jgi:hypothetical protein